MRAAFLLLVSSLTAAAVAPVADPTARYANMMEQSPFALATAPEAPKEATESFAANWELTGLARTRNEQGEEKDFVTVRSRDRHLSLSFVGNAESTEPEALGVSLQSVDWQEGSRKSTITLKKGNELAKVEFSQDAAPAAGGAVAAAGGGPLNANQQRAVQMQVQQQRAQQLQQQLQQQQAQALRGQTGAVYNPATINKAVVLPNGQFGGMQPGQVAPQFNGNSVMNSSMLPNNGVVNTPNNGTMLYPQPPLGAVNKTAPNAPDPRRRVRTISTNF